MAFFLKNGQVTEIVNPEINKQLTKGATRLNATNLAAARRESISAKDLEPTRELQFEPPKLPQDIDISGLQSLTPSEVKQTDMEKRLSEVVGKIADKPFYEAEQAKLFGVNKSQQALDDLNTQLKDLQRQQKAVPLVLQQESIGRGRTVGGIEPLEIGRRREIAIEALTTGSLIDAAQGRVLSAMRKVDQAVNEKFAPLIAEENALRSQLDILENSPETTRQERSRLAKQKDALDKRKKARDKVMAEQKAILSWATKATSDLAKEGLLTTDMLVKIDDIQNATTEGEAAQLYSDIVAELPVEEDITEFTQSQKLKLEQAGLSNATRQEKLDYLFGGRSVETTPDKPLSPNGLTQMKELFPNIDIQPGDTMTDIEEKKAKKFAEDNAGKNPDEIKKAITENTSLTEPEIEKKSWWQRIKGFFTGGQTKEMTNKEFADSL